MRSLEFEVRGLPVAQGSARAFMAGGKAHIASEGNRPRSPLGSWRSSIAQEARTTIGMDPAITGPVAVSAVFWMPRPRSHYLPANRTRPAPVLRVDAPVFCMTKPDSDKLARAVLDAITVVAIGDDAAVVILSAQKRYADPHPVGVRIRILEAWF